MTAWRLLALLLLAAAAAAGDADLDFAVKANLAAEPHELRVEAAGEQLLVAALATGRRVEGADRVEPGDQLVSVDGTPVVLQTLSEALSQKHPVVLPIIDDDSLGKGHLVRGFARVEVLTPKTYTFRPTSPERLAQLRAEHEEAQRAAAEARRAVEEAEAEARQAERDAAKAAQREKQAAADREKQRAQEAKLRKQREEDDRRRQEKELARKIAEGAEFEYDVVFDHEGPLGLQIHPEHSNLTILEVARGGAAARMNVREGDLLLSVNDKDVTGMTPANALMTLARANWPKRVRFRRPAVVKEEVVEVPDYYLTFEAPRLLRGVALRVQPSSWSGDVGASPCASRAVIVARPEEACAVPANAEPGALVLAHRGTCTFYDKFVNVVEGGGAAGLVVVNNAESVVEMPHGQPEDPDTTAAMAMLPRFEGSALALAVAGAPDARAWGRLGPAGAQCAASDKQLPPLSGAPRDGDEGGVLHFQTAAGEWAFPYHAGHDGGRFNASLVVPVVAAVPPTACSHKNIKVRLSQAYVLVQRGDCAFGDKALALQHMGAAGMILYNSDGPSFRVSLTPDEADKVKIPIGAISSDHGAELLAQIRELPPQQRPMARLEETEYYFAP